MIELQNISKIFNPGTVNEARLFQNFSVKVAPGEFVSVVGSNGSGKTTMLNIISGTLPITGGKVLLQGQDITNLPEYKRARKIGRVFQNPAAGTVPGMTITENLALAENKGKPYRFQFAINHRKAQQFRELVQQLGLGLEDKMNVPVGLLSGGQRQRVSIARAILKNPPILILDEATSALDTESERLVQEALERLMKSRTTIAIAHRLSTIKNADEICVLYEGEIVERGTHEELIALNGYYKKLNDMQSL